MVCCVCVCDDVKQTLFFPPLPILASRVKRQTAQSEEEEDDGGRVCVCSLSLSLSLVSCASRVCDDASSTHNIQKRSNNTHTLVRKQTAVLFFSFFLLI